MPDFVSQIYINGKYQSLNTLDINTIQRALVYGDCVCEELRTNASRILFFGRHIEKLCNTLKFMNMQIPQRFSSDRALLKEELSKLLIKNKIFKGGLLTLIMCRQGEFDLNSQLLPIQFIATTTPLPEVLLKINNQGFSLSYFTDITYPMAPLANVNTYAGSIVKNLAAQYAFKYRLHDALILNNNGVVVEAAIFGSVFCVRDSVIYTASLSDGCVDTVMRRLVLDAAESLGIKVDENTPITQDFLKTVDEIFLASTKYGIKWVGALKNRRFYRRTAEMILNKINEYYTDEF